MNGTGFSERPSWPGDVGAWRLLIRVEGACKGCDGLPARLEAGLRAALEMLAAEPELAYELTVAPWLESDDGILDAQRAWMARFGDLLGDAVSDDPATTTPCIPSLASFLIGGVRFQIGRLVLKKEASDLPRLLPSLLEGVLAYYFEPGESPALARRQRSGRDGCLNGCLMETRLGPGSPVILQAEWGMDGEPPSTPD
jgi:hypothetical protein